MVSLKVILIVFTSNVSALTKDGAIPSDSVLFWSLALRLPTKSSTAFASMSRFVDVKPVPMADIVTLTFVKEDYYV